MNLRDSYNQLVAETVRECRSFYGDRLISMCLFGSVARGTMSDSSDIDLLLVVDPLPDGRMNRVREFSAVENNLLPKIAMLRRVGIHASLSPLFKTKQEVGFGSLVFLDMMHEGVILFDREVFLQSQFDRLRKRLGAQGARRIQKGEAWYWILKEPYEIGEEFEV